MMFSKVEKCRICGSSELTKYLDLGIMPLANSYVDPKSNEKENAFPLEVVLCSNCSLSMLSIIVSPEAMFSNYVYHSSISRTFQNHCLEMAIGVKERLGGKDGLFVLDIASNDGCLLREFRKKGFKVLGVDPAKNLAEKANKEGIATIPEFWQESVALEIIKKHGKADAITATNVFAHVDDVHGFLGNVLLALSDEGVLIIEAPYALNLIKHSEFDTIYHEHLSYFLVKPLKMLFEMNGMELRDVEEYNIHGGSIRLFATKKGNTSFAANPENIKAFLELESREKLYSAGAYFEFASKLLDIKIELLSLLSRLHKEGKMVSGYGASAKGNTMLNYCGISSDFVEFIVDETPEKQNMLYAGNHIPIYPASELEKRKPEYILILAWNFAKEIIEKTAKHQERSGKYIVPIPKMRVLSGAEEL